MRVRLAGIAAWALLAMLPGECLAGRGDERDERVAWLRVNAIPFATLDPTHSDLADLEPLRRVLDGVRVVMLGEATRGDGSAFLAKTRLIRFLHQELGFDVVVFESGFYDCARAWEEIRAGGDPHAAVRRALFPFYAEAAQFQPLIELIGARASTDRSLAVAGIDTQTNGETNGERMIGELRAALAGFGIEPSSVGGLPELESALGHVLRGRYTSGELTVPSVRDRRRLIATLGELRGRLAAARDSQPGAVVSDRAFWLQVLDNLETDAETIWRMGKWRPGDPFAPELHNLRDRQMGDNLIWLARHRYRDRKIIVWSLNVHLARDLDRLATGEAAARARFDEMSTVGDRVADALRGEVYTLAVTAFAGRKGTPFNDPYPLLTPTAGSFEDLMARTGLEAALVDLRRPPPGGHWLQRALIARPISYKELLGIWPRHVDGLLFLRTMEPANRVGR